MSMRRTAVIAAIQTHNLLDKPQANRTEPVRKYPKSEDDYDDNHINLLFTGIILGIIFTILLLICHYCYRHFNKQPEIIYRQHYFDENTNQNLENPDIEQGSVEDDRQNINQNVRAELITPEYYKNVSGPPPPYDLVVSMSNEQNNENAGDIIDAPPPWKEAWIAKANEEKPTVDNESQTTQHDEFSSDAGAVGVNRKDSEENKDSELKAKEDVPVTVEILKTELNRNIDRTGLPTYEATMRLEASGYF